MNLNNIIRCFGISAAESITKIESGHINNTFLVDCNDEERYILQSLNQSVFRYPETVMENIAKLEKIFSASGDERVTIPHYICTGDGINYAEADGEIYRMYKYAEILPQKSDHFYMTGFAFGFFIRKLSEKNLRLESTIEKFHDFSSHFSVLTNADKISSLKKIDSIVMRRLASLKETLDQVFTVDFPMRNVHNDAKINNVIFGERCTVIDLDTAMKGYAAIDYGDMIRSACVSEKLDFTVIRDITNGFASGLNGILTEDEIYSLYYGILYVTGELAVRYLIDYLNDEKYFRDKTASDCLSRANELLSQLNTFIKHGDDITSIIYKAFRKQ